MKIIKKAFLSMNFDPLFPRARASSLNRGLGKMEATVDRPMSRHCHVNREPLISRTRLLGAGN